MLAVPYISLVLASFPFSAPRSSVTAGRLRSRLAGHSGCGPGCPGQPLTRRGRAATEAPAGGVSQPVGCIVALLAGHSWRAATATVVTPPGCFNRASGGHVACTGSPHVYTARCDCCGATSRESVMSTDPDTVQAEGRAGATTSTCQVAVHVAGRCLGERPASRHKRCRCAAHQHGWLRACEDAAQRPIVGTGSSGVGPCSLHARQPRLGGGLSGHAPQAQGGRHSGRSSRPLAPSGWSGRTPRQDLAAALCRTPHSQPPMPTAMKLLFVLLLVAASGLASAARAGGRPQLRNFATAADAAASAQRMRQMVRAHMAGWAPPPPLRRSCRREQSLVRRCACPAQAALAGASPPPLLDTRACAVLPDPTALPSAGPQSPVCRVARRERQAVCVAGQGGCRVCSLQRQCGRRGCSQLQPGRPVVQRCAKAGLHVSVPLPCRRCGMGGAGQAPRTPVCLAGLSACRHVKANPRHRVKAAPS